MKRGRRFKNEHQVSLGNERPWERVALGVTHRIRGISKEARPQSTEEEPGSSEVVSGCLAEKGI